MRKLSIVPLILITSCVVAQETKSNSPNRKPYFSNLELLAGPSFPFVTGNKYVEDSRQIKLAFAASLGLIHQLNTKIDLSVRLFFERKGSKAGFSIVDNSFTPPAKENVSQEISLDYIGVEILPKYYIDQKHQLYVGVGMYMTYLLKENVSVYFHRNDTLISHSITVLKSDFDYKPLDWGLTLQTGYNFKVSKRTLGSIQLMGNAGLIKANKPDLLPTRLNSITIQVGVIINNKKRML